MEQNNKVNFVELAEYCTNEFKEYCREENKVRGVKYVNTVYFAISDKGIITLSYTPHILKDTHRCILLHTFNQFAETQWYNNHKFRYIDELGNVRDNQLDENHTILMKKESYIHCAYMKLYRRKSDYIYGTELIKFDAPFDVSKMSRLWEIYLKSRNCKSEGEADIMAKLIHDELYIQTLKSENDNLNYMNTLLKKEKEEHEKLLKKLNEILDSHSK